MATILLLGAGFSKNWGAPIASEFFTALIRDDEIRRNEQIRNLLWRNRTNFEDALAGLQQNYRQDKKRHRAALLLVQGAIGRVFDRLNAMYRRQDFELHQDRLVVDKSRTVVEFLAKFDAIFTLNQDLLLEIHYFDQARNLTTNRRWSGAIAPGMQPRGQAAQAPWSGREWTPDGDFSVLGQLQPVYKIHGSTNWKTIENADMLIMGGGKRASINDFAVLRKYHDALAEQVHQGSVRMVVIGYGFRDDHINEILKDGVVNHGLLLHVIDPRGAGLAYDMRGFGPNQIGPAVTSFEEWFEKGLYSASTIPFRRLLLEETLDREYLEDFLAGH